MMEDLKSDYESLLQFMYMAPVGLVQMQADGNIIMINPYSANLLIPIAPNGDLYISNEGGEGVATILKFVYKK